jgi:hypothetical protein
MDGILGVKFGLGLPAGRLHALSRNMAAAMKNNTKIFFLTRMVPPHLNKKAQDKNSCVTKKIIALKKQAQPLWSSLLQNYLKKRNYSVVIASRRSCSLAAKQSRYYIGGLLRARARTPSQWQ